MIPDPMMPPINPRDLFLLTLLISASWTDIKEQKIYNKLTFPMTLVGIVSAPVWDTPWAGLFGAGVGLLVSLPLELLRVIRMGDVKLLMAAGALVGPSISLRAVLLSVAINLVYGVGVLAWKGRLGRLLSFYRNPGQEPTVVAYGPAISVAVVLARLQPWP